MIARQPARTGDFTRNPLIGRLLALSSALGLDAGDFVVFGSAPLLAYGIRRSIRDIDVVARGRTWETVVHLGEPSEGTVSGDPVYLFDEGLIQFSDRWISPAWDTDELIDRAEDIDGLRFARLSDVLRYKQELMRPKDLADIHAIADVLTHGRRSGAERRRP